MKSIHRIFGIATVTSFMAVSLLAQAPVNGTVNSSTNPGVCDGSGAGQANGKGNARGYGVGNGSGNQGTRPQDGTGYGAKRQHPASTMGTQGGFSRGQGNNRQGGGMRSRRNNG